MPRHSSKLSRAGAFGILPGPCALACFQRFRRFWVLDWLCGDLEDFEIRFGVGGLVVWGEKSVVSFGIWGL